MEKRIDAQVYIMAHKPLTYGIWANALYTPVQVGFGERFLDVRDSDDPDNISEWNAVYAELTGAYYIWKHMHPTKYKGTCQYRRRLEFKEDADFDAIFKDCDVIMPKGLHMKPVWQYSHCHNAADMALVKNIVLRNNPEYAPAWEKYMEQGSRLFYSQSCVMRAEDYDRYAEWLFSTLSEFCREKGWDTPDKCREDIDSEIKCGHRPSARGVAYQMQICGFLGERLLTFFVLSNFDGRIKEINYRKYEGV